jgi:excisionase family DNA binding protein
MTQDSHKAEEELLTPEGAANYLNISISTLYRYLNRKKNPIPSYKFSSKNIRIKKEELDLWMIKNLNTESKQNSK